MARKFFTIGYQSTTVRNFLDTLVDAKVDLLVDVRAVAMSRRPGFAKSALSANLKEVGIKYLHLRKLGTPADGRAAARAGRHDEMHQIFNAQLQSEPAQDELRILADLVRGQQAVAIMCFEAEAKYCHRAIVAKALADVMDIEIIDLMPDVGDVH